MPHGIVHASCLACDLQDDATLHVANTSLETGLVANVLAIPSRFM